MDSVSGVTHSIIDELHYSNVKQDQMEGESGDTRSINDEPHSPDMQRSNGR